MLCVKSKVDRIETSKRKRERERERGREARIGTRCQQRSSTIDHRDRPCEDDGGMAAVRAAFTVEMLPRGG
jgi:hypothetical protein